VQEFEEHLNKLHAQHLLRCLKPVEPVSGALVTIGGRPVIQMASNNYLGLATHPTLKQAAVAAIHQYGVGAGASRLISGTLPPHQDLESALARFKGTEAALTFGAGYLANLGLIPALIGSSGLILADRLCHASLIDGCRLSGADVRVFRHRDLAHVETLLAKRPARRKTLIVTDGVFSMDGDLAPLPELIALADRHGARLFIDDAHGTGVMGASGRGILEHFGVEARLPFHMGTLGKALGTGGAYVVGPATLIRYFVNTVRSFIYTTAPPPAEAAAALAALEVLRTEPERRARLWDNRKHFHAGLAALGFETTDTQSPIMPVLIGDPEKAMAMAERLLQLGVYAPAIRPPTVPKETSRIRTTVTAEHSTAQLDRALEAFRTAGQELRLI
jgi:8-amino-7-oxononanoate synthase